MSVYTTEIASETITSDNPIHQRLLKAYVVAAEMVRGNLLEVGCGEGRGVFHCLETYRGGIRLRDCTRGHIQLAGSKRPGLAAGDRSL